MLGLMRRTLTDAGHGVLSATNGFEALELAATAVPRVDAVVGADAADPAVQPRRAEAMHHRPSGEHILQLGISSA